jgi:UDP-N-acetylmuramyl pentapeptide phosphotransferase/UDP-N-acetylglucosamine-1-phosphate transferase
VALGVLVLVVAGCIHWDQGLVRAAAGALLVAGVSFVDDRIGLKPAPRFLVHLAAAALLISGPWAPDTLVLPSVSWEWPPWLARAFGLTFAVWMLNLYNFMDGMDGFAGGMAVIGFGTLAIIGAIQGDVAFTGLNASVAAAALGFLIFNFPPARIFMGDAGSSTLGFLAAAALLWGNHAQLLPLWLGILIFSPFIVDATVTLLRRALRREKIWEAHRTHYYQRAVQLGWGHQATVVGEYLLMLGAALTALALLSDPNGWLGLLAVSAWAVLYFLLAVVVRSAERDISHVDKR